MSNTEQQTVTNLNDRVKRLFILEVYWYTEAEGASVKHVVEKIGFDYTLHMKPSAFTASPGVIQISADTFEEYKAKLEALSEFGVFQVPKRKPFQRIEVRVGTLDNTEKTLIFESWATTLDELDAIYERDTPYSAYGITEEADRVLIRRYSGGLDVFMPFIVD